MPRHGVQYVNDEEPSFIKQFKQRIGHKDGPDVNTKRNIPNFDEDGDEDIPEKEDEKPVVVVIKEGDLTAEEAQEEQKQFEEGPARLDEKITFKKPVKRSKDSEETNNESKEEPKKKKKEGGEKNANSSKKAANSSLLSFDCDEEDDNT